MCNSFFFLIEAGNLKNCIVPRRMFEIHSCESGILKSCPALFRKCSACGFKYLIFTTYCQQSMQIIYCPHGQPCHIERKPHMELLQCQPSFHEMNQCLQEQMRLTVRKKSQIIKLLKFHILQVSECLKAICLKYTTLTLKPYKFFLDYILTLFLNYTLHF